jgi:hypothetical protein
MTAQNDGARLTQYGIARTREPSSFGAKPMIVNCMGASIEKLTDGFGGRVFVSLQNYFGSQNHFDLYWSYRSPQNLGPRLGRRQKSG